MASAPQLLVVQPGMPVKSVQDLIKVARAKPGELNFGSGGAGTLAYPSGELFKSMAGVNLVHVPYKGAILALNDLLGGRLHIVFSDMPVALPHAKTGKVRALAVTSAQRTSLVPDMPTVAESGVPGYAIENSWGVFAHEEGALGDHHETQRRDRARAQPAGRARPLCVVRTGGRQQHAGRLRENHPG